MATRTESPSQHTFLMSDAIWEAKGTGWVGDDAREAPITGRTEVRGLGGGLTVAESTMTVHAEVPFDVHQHYDVRATSHPDRFTFVTRNDRVGELLGEVSLMPDYIVLHYASAKGRWRGAEMLIRRSPDHYTAIGQFVADRKVQTIWQVELHRVSGGRTA